MKKPKKRTRRKRKNVKPVLVIGHILLWGWISQILCLFSIQTAEVSLLRCTFLNLFSHTIYLCFNYPGSKMNRSDFGIQIYRAGTSIVQHFCQTATFALSLLLLSRISFFVIWANVYKCRMALLSSWFSPRRIRICISISFIWFRTSSRVLSKK